MVVFWFVDDWGLTVLIKDNSFCVHQQNIHRLMIEIHKIFNNIINVYDLFDSSHDLNLESQQDLVIPSVNNVLNGKNSLRYFGSVL